jgi:hypothetical protein
MKPILPTTTGTPPEDNIANIQSALEEFWRFGIDKEDGHIAEPTEQEKHDFAQESAANPPAYGAVTKTLVERFRQTQGDLENGDSVTVDTAKRMNEKLALQSRRKVGLIRGKTKKSDGSVARGWVVGASWLKDEGQDQESWQPISEMVTSDSHGNFELFYDYEAMLESARRKWVAAKVEVYRGTARVGTEKLKFYRPLPSTVEDCELNVPDDKGNDFTKIKKQSDKQLNAYGLNAISMSEEDVELINEGLETPYSQAQVEHWAAACRMASYVRRILDPTGTPAWNDKEGLCQEVFFAMLREDVLLRITMTLPVQARTFVGLSYTQMVREKENMPGLMTDVANLIRNSVTASGHTRTILELLSGAEINETIPSGWMEYDSLTAALSIVAERKALLEEVAAAFPGSSDSMPLLDVVLGSASEIVKRAFISKGEVISDDALPKLATMPPSAWEALFETTGTGTDAERSGLAHTVARGLEMAQPAAAFVSMSSRKGLGDKGKIWSEVRGIATSLLKDGQLEDLATMDLSKPEVKTKSGVTNLNKKQHGAALAFQRLFRIAPRYEEAKALSDLGFASAHSVRRMGGSQFVSRYMEQRRKNLAAGVSVDERALRAEGRGIYDRAKSVVTVTGHFMAEMKSLVVAKDLHALSDKKHKVELNKLCGDKKVLPTLEGLFGVLDSCACEHCQSVYSPASYLVELLAYMGRLGIDKTTNATVMNLFESRRPDVPYIDLNCANTETEMPDIDLICERLEDLVAGQTEDMPGISLKQYNESVELGAIDTKLLAHLHGKGVREMTNNAVVSEDSRGGRLVRDARALVLLLPRPRPTNNGLPLRVKCGPVASWDVFWLRQTYGTTDEVSAYPEYINREAYRILMDKNSWMSPELPFDLNHVESGVFLDALSLKRWELLGDLAKQPQMDDKVFWTQVSAEAIGLADARREIITTPAETKADQGRFWGEDAGQVVQRMAKVRRFLKKCDLETEPVSTSELKEMLHGDFISPPACPLAVVSEDMSSPATWCDTTKMHIANMSVEALDRINRLLRLHRVTGWPMELIDRLIMSPSIGNQFLDDDCVLRLGQIKKLSVALELKFEEVAAWFCNLGTWGEHTAYAARFERKECDPKRNLQVSDSNYLASYRVMRLAALRDYHAKDGSQLPDEHNNLSSLKEHKPYLALCLGVSVAHLDNLFAYIPAAAERTLGNLSRLAGLCDFIAAMELDAAGFAEFLTVTGLGDPMASPRAALRFLEVLTLVRKWELSPADLNFFLLHNATSPAELVQRELPATTMGKTLNSVLKTFQAMAQVRRAREVTGEDDLAACLEKLTQALATVNGLEPSRAQDLLKLLQQRKNQSDADKLVALLKANPLGDVPKVIQLASDLLVTSPGVWQDDPADGSAGSSHGPHREWTRAFVTALFDDADKKERREVVLKEICSGMQMERDDAEVLLEQARMPANGGHPLPILVAADPAGTSPSLWTIDESLWVKHVDYVQAAVETRPEVIAALPGELPKFRDAVLTNQPFTNTTLPSADVRELESIRQALSLRHNCLRLVHKTVALAAKLNLSARDHLAWGLTDASPAPKNRFEALGWLSLDDLPLATNSTAPADDSRCKLLEQLLHGLGLLMDYPLKPEATNPDLKFGASTVFELTLRTQPAATRQDVLDLCYRLFGKPEDKLDLTADWLGLSVADFKDGRAYARLKLALQRVRELGIPADVQVTQLADFFDLVVKPEVVERLRLTLKSRTPYTRWLGKLQELYGPVRIAKRDALLAFVTSGKNPRFKSDDDLYDFFLFDFKSKEKLTNSRIVQAHAAVQALIQRCKDGREPVDVEADPEGDWDEWQWMCRYRVWEANRKVFLYPENWIDPELRDDKSQFFKELEQQLQQDALTDTTTEGATRSYLEKLDEASFLEVMTAHYEDSIFFENGRREGRVLHVVARTRSGEPRVYFYRRYIEEREWTPWEKIELDITTDHVLLFVRNRRLHLAWPVFTEEVDENQEPPFPKDNGAKTLNKNKRGWRIQLAISERSEGRWQPKTVSEQSLTTEKFEEAAGTMNLARQRCKFIVRNQYLVSQIKGSKREQEPQFLIMVYGPFQKSPNSKDDILIGSFNLASCRAAAEAILPSSGRTRFMPLPANSKTYPAIVDTELRTQRWTELGADHDPGLVIHGLKSALEEDTTVLKQTPGIFKVTTVQQTTRLDRAWMKVLGLPEVGTGSMQSLGEELAGGLFAPFFFVDGRRGFVITPRFRQANNRASLGAACEAVAKIETELKECEKRARLADELRLKNPPETPAEDNIDQPRSQTTLFAALERPDNEGGSQDKRNAVALLRDWLGQPTRLEFGSFYHPFTCWMKRELQRGGVKGLMHLSSIQPGTTDPDSDVDAATQTARGLASTLTSWPYDFKATYDPNYKVISAHPEERHGFEFKRRDAYAGYNWEVFYHLPSLIAKRLAKDEQFEDSKKWHNFVFDPAGSLGIAAPGRFWVTKPFRDRDKLSAGNKDSYASQEIRNLLAQTKRWEQEVMDWRKNPFVPHLIARGRTVAFQKASVMHYLDMRLAWADSLFRRDQREDITQALAFYMEVKRMLGDKPVQMPPPFKMPSRTYRELELDLNPNDDDADNIDAFGNALVRLENFLPPPDCLPCRSMDPLPVTAGMTCTIVCKPGSKPLNVPYFCIPRNEKWLEYWNLVEDRLEKIRSSQNIDGIERKLALFAPPIDPGLLVRARAAGLSIGDVLAAGAGELPIYRYQVLAQKAVELVQMTQSFGSQLLSVLEKKDAEVLARFKSSQEIDLLKQVREVKKLQITEAEHTLESLRRTKLVTEARHEFYRDVQYLSGLEGGGLGLHGGAIISETAATVLNSLGGTMHLIPDLTLGASGFGGSPVATTTLPTGTKIGESTFSWGAVFGGLGGILHSGASLTQTLAGYERRWDEWKLQEKLAKRELAQIENQINAAEVRLDISKAELRNHDRQTAQAEATLEFYRQRKFTNQELYEWMCGELSALYYQSFQLAHRFAVRVERAFHFEIGPRPDGVQKSYVRADAWDRTRKGLLAGEKLLSDLKAMETDYLALNRREFELTKTISLSRLDPDRLLQLKANGQCEISLPEWLFDMDRPGHYLRRIKSVSLSIPCVAGPRATINCTLTLTRSTLRIRPNKVDDLDADEANLLRNFSSVQSIGTSTAQNDSGMFEVNFRDDRLLPFEGLGPAESTWTIELAKQDNRELDFNSICDVEMHLKYTSRYGGTAFKVKQRRAMDRLWKNGVADSASIGGKRPIMRRIFFLADEFPAEWAKLNNDPETMKVRTLKLQKLRDRLPYFWQRIQKKVLFPRLFDEAAQQYSNFAFKTNSSIIPPTTVLVDLDDETEWFFEFNITKKLSSLALIVEANLD